MKKFNFATEASDKTQDAIIDVNNTAPMDFVGRMCVSKLKIPKNSMPIALVPPLSGTFTLSQKRQIDAVGETPTELYFALFCQNTRKASSTYSNCPLLECKGNGTFVIPDTLTNDLELVANDLFAMFFVHYWMNEKPIWQLNGDGNYQLMNKPKPIYRWYTNSYVEHSPFVGYSNDFTYHCFQIGDGYDGRWDILTASILNNTDKFSIITNVRLHTTSEEYYTPVIALSKWLVQTNNLVDNVDPTHSDGDYDYAESEPPSVKFNEDALAPGETRAPADIYAMRRMYIIHANMEYTPSYQTLLSTQRSTDTQYQDFSATYNFINFDQSTSLFPITHIAIQCLDLNYLGEDMSINTRDLEGTIVPSQMYFLKTFLVSTRNTLSDFLYIEDNTMTNTIEVNSPNITRLKFQFFWITPSQELYEFKLPPNNVIQLQLILYPFDTIATKRSRD